MHHTCLRQFAIAVLLGKSVDLPICHGHVIHAVCVCVCVSMCKHSHRSNLGENLKCKNDVNKFGHLQSGCDIANVVLRALDLLFQG